MSGALIAADIDCVLRLLPLVFKHLAKFDYVLK